MKLHFKVILQSMNGRETKTSLLQAMAKIDQIIEYIFKQHNALIRQQINHE